MLQYQKTGEYFAQISSGMEELGAEELNELGAKNIKQVHRGIHFEADKKGLYQINYQSRLISRILAPLKKFKCHQSRYLYKKAQEIQWSDFFTVDQTFVVFANVSHSEIRHSQYAALVLKDAIVDQFRQKTGSRPSIDKIDPDVWINLHIESDFATISWDTSGGSLHRRGYRSESVDAPMQETLAAAIIRLSKWNGIQSIYDPFCGSGTLLCEALMKQCGIPANLLRERFGFEFLPDFESHIWQKLKMQTKEQIQELKNGVISGSDISYQAIKNAEKNISNLPFGDKINLKVIDFKRIKELENTIIVSNPPYGIRQSNQKSVEKLYKSLGDFLKQKCKGSIAFIYFGDRRLISKIELRPCWKKPLKNGGHDGRLVNFEIY